MSFVLYFLAAFGLAFIFGASKISLPVRQLLAGGAYNDAEGIAHWRGPRIPYVGPFLVALVECPGCLGWWIGWAVGSFFPEFVIFNAPNVGIITESWWGLGILLGLATAASNMVIGKFVGLVE